MDLCEVKVSMLSLQSQRAVAKGKNASASISELASRAKLLRYNRQMETVLLISYIRHHPVPHRSSILRSQSAGLQRMRAGYTSSPGPDLSPSSRPVRPIVISALIDLALNQPRLAVQDLNELVDVLWFREKLHFLNMTPVVCSNVRQQCAIPSSVHGKEGTSLTS